MASQISCVWFVSHSDPPCTRPLAQAYAGIGPYHLSESSAFKPLHTLPEKITAQRNAKVTSDVANGDHQADHTLVLFPLENVRINGS